MQTVVANLEEAHLNIICQTGEAEIKVPFVEVGTLEAQSFSHTIIMAFREVFQQFLICDTQYVEND